MSDLKELKPINYVQNLINKFCYTIGMIPTSYKMSLTYEEQILAIGHYLETVVYPAINNNAEATAELQSLYIDLKNYVNNYFEDLDVQEEVNNKLNEMAQSGQLAELISQYLESQSIIGFNTINDLKNATNLANGSFAKTYGSNSYNDGDGNFYKIRNRVNQDNPDNYNLIVLSNTTNLIAERISSLYEKNLHNLTYRISKKLETKIVCAGDSLTYGTNPANGQQSQVTYPNSLQSFINNWLETNIVTCINKGIPRCIIFSKY